MQKGDQRVCDDCLKEIKGGAWIVNPPAEHPLATEAVLHLCSDTCLVKHIKTSVEKYGAYKSKVSKVYNPSKEYKEDQEKRKDVEQIPNQKDEP